MDITEHPQGSYLLPRECEHRCAYPLDPLTSRLVTKELRTVHPCKQQACKRLIALSNHLVNLAPIVAKRCMHKVDIRREARMAVPLLAQRTPERKIFMEEFWNLRFIMLVPDFLVECSNDGLMVAHSCSYSSSLKHRTLCRLQSWSL